MNQSKNLSAPRAGGWTLNTGAWSCVRIAAAAMVAVVMATLTPQAMAGVFTLDFETPATGSTVVNGTVLNSPLGTITFNGPFGTTGGNPLPSTVLSFNDIGGYVYLRFGFAVDSISGVWGDRGFGTMQIEGLDISNNIVGYFFFAGAGGANDSGSFSFNPSADIYTLRIADTSHNFGELDNIVITTSVPGGAGLAACGLLGLIRRRRR